MDKKELDRREFIKQTARIGAMAAVLGAPTGYGNTLQDKKTGSTGAKPGNMPGTIPTRVLGKTGLQLPILGFGGAALPRAWGNPLSFEDRIKLVRYAFDRGLRYFDTAANYMDSEDIIGRGLEGIRKEVCLVTKVETTKVAEVRSSVEQSMQALQTDYLDVILIHGTPGLEQMSVEQAMKIHAELADLRAEGITRFIGFSAHSYFDKALALIASGEFDLCMLSYGYLGRGYNQIFSARMAELRNTCIAKAHEQGMGIVAMKVVGAGMLGAFSSMVVPGFDKARLQQLPAAAIAYVLQDPRIHLLNIGMRLKDEIDANIRTLSGDPAYTLDSQALLAEYTAQALASDAIKAMRVD